METTGERYGLKKGPATVEQGRGIQRQTRPEIPMTVRRIITPVIVDLQDERGKWHRHVHVQDLKIDPIQVEPEEET